MKIMAFSPITYDKQMGKQWKQWQTLFSWAPKSLQMVTVAMKLKDACSLEETLWLASVQFSCSVMSDSLWPHGLQHARLPCPTPIPIAYSISCPWHCDAIQPSCPLSSPAPPAFNLSQHQGLFKWVSSLHQVAKYWSFSFSISPSNEYSGLISFRMDWLDLLAVQGTLENLFQHHSSEASVFSTQSSL